VAERGGEFLLVDRRSDVVGDRRGEDGYLISGELDSRQSRDSCEDVRLIVEELTGVRSDRAERGNDLIRRVELASPERDKHV